MEPTQSPSESEPGVHSGEDFVHIEEHSKPTGDFSLSDSIVNVEKEDAVEEEEEEEEEHKEDSDSVASVGGDDAAGGDGDGECSSAKVELPEELAKSVVILTCESNGESGSCDVYLIGTAHVSKESCREVKEIIRFLKPEAVFVELCSSRVSILQPQSVKMIDFVAFNDKERCQSSFISLKTEYSFYQMMHEVCVVCRNRVCL
ncbi:hypothetical protein DY000_02058211 [Brassica cretica]|uniref:TraB family protein n=1 Tax=Brassica cretica TaxID=69181 RepID=A0ABQ7A8C1_BRACR|nr:hypothetical protein DY000_02058211 [Brassica cretica]